jgi:hypothetical protein
MSTSSLKNRLGPGLSGYFYAIFVCKMWSIGRKKNFSHLNSTAEIQVSI